MGRPHSMDACCLLVVHAMAVPNPFGVIVCRLLGTRRSSAAQQSVAADCARRRALPLNGSVDMQFGPRLMRRRPPFGQPPEEIEILRNVLSSAPGVAAVRSIELHRKGGYVAVMDFDRNSLDEFI